MCCRLEEITLVLSLNIQLIQALSIQDPKTVWQKLIIFSLFCLIYNFYKQLKLLYVKICLSWYCLENTSELLLIIININTIANMQNCTNKCLEEAQPNKQFSQLYKTICTQEIDKRRVFMHHLWYPLCHSYLWFSYFNYALSWIG